jgi:hypothetical protein
MKPRAQLLRMHPLCGVFICILLTWCQNTFCDLNLLPLESTWIWILILLCAAPLRERSPTFPRGIISHKKALYGFWKTFQGRMNIYCLSWFARRFSRQPACVWFWKITPRSLRNRCRKSRERERLEHAVPCIIKSHSSWCVLLFGEREKNGFFCLAANEAKRIPSSKTNEPSAAAFHAYRLWKLLFP